MVPSLLPGHNAPCIQPIRESHSAPTQEMKALKFLVINRDVINPKTVPSLLIMPPLAGRCQAIKLADSHTDQHEWCWWLSDIRRATNVLTSIQTKRLRGCPTDLWTWRSWARYFWAETRPQWDYIATFASSLMLLNVIYKNSILYSQKPSFVVQCVVSVCHDLAWLTICISVCVMTAFRPSLLYIAADVNVEERVTQSSRFVFWDGSIDVKSQYMASD